MDIDEERIAYCALNGILGFNPKLGAELVDRAGGSAAEVFRMNASDKSTLFPGDRSSVPRISGRSLDDARRELMRLEEEGVRFICAADPDYPPLLRECADPPLGLYMKSCSPAAEVFTRGLPVAVVGTREMTSYGRDWCEGFIKAAASTGNRITVISGLAYGIDITAHRAALDSGLATVGVMATGIDRVYPSRHAATAERMARTPGCALVTDYPPGTPPVAANFLRRNRIIAALAAKAVLVESKARGGGMMTARLAYSYEREVYALPGRVSDPRSGGCNLLISGKAADALLSPEESVRIMGLGVPGEKADITETVRSMYADLDGASLEEAVAVTEAIGKERGLDMSGISARTGLGLSTVLSVTGMLSSDGLIEVNMMGECRIK